MEWLSDFLLHRGNDLSTYFLPNAYFFKRTFLQYQIPLWNPLQLGGIPYLADPQNYLFYPPNYIFLLLPIEPAFLALIFGHLLWGALGMRKLTHSWFSSIIFVFSPMMMSHLEAGHYTMLVAFSWLPWFLLAALRFVKKPTLKLCGLLAAVSWLLYINYINIAYYALLFLGSYTIFYFFTHRQNFPIQKYIIHNSLYIILFLILISPNLLAQLEFAPHSTRSLITFNDVAQPIWSFKLFFQNLFFPFFLNSDQLSTERVLYPGLIVLVLAIYGFKQKPHKFFAQWIIFSLLFALGSRIPFFIFFYKFFPLMKFMRIPPRIWIISILFIALFAGKGLQKLSKKFSTGIIVLCFLDILLIDYKIFSRPIIKSDVPESFYQLLVEDNSFFRVYCTTGCFSLQRLGELNIPTIGGNNPIQNKNIVDKLAQASGYVYDKYIPILPPYEVFNRQPQPNAKLMKELQVKYIASPYPLNDPNLELIARTAQYLLYTVQ